MIDIPMKYKVIAGAVVITAAFASGRYSVHGTSETKTVTTTVKQDKTEHKKIVVDKKPTGEVTTTITDDTDVKTADTKTVTDVKIPVAAKRDILNVSGMIGNDFLGSKLPVYGVVVTKEVPIFGVPFTTGPFALTDTHHTGIVGWTLGLDF